MAILAELPESRRSGVTTFTTPSAVAPVTDGDWIRVQVTIPASEIDDPANALWIRFFAAPPPGLVWTGIAAVRWQGGGPPASVWVPATRVVGNFVRAEVDVAKSMRFGAIVTSEYWVEPE